MGFLSKKQTAAVETAAYVEAAQQRLQQVEEQQAQERAWLQSLSDADAERLLDAIVEAFDKVRDLAGRSSNPERELHVHEKRLMPVIEDVKKTWLSIDRSQLLFKDTTLLYETLRTDLPRWAGLYREKASLYGIHVALFGDHFGLGQGHRLRIQVADRLVSLLAIQHNQWTDAYVESMPGSKLLVPVVHDDVVLVAALQEFHGLWVRADSCALDSADRFFVDEVALRYFPDSWKMLQSFVGGDEVMFVSARSIFLEQVSLMGQRLRNVNVKSQEASLGAMQAHSSFLREVTA